MTDTNQAAALAALIEGSVVCRRCGTPTVRHQTGEPVCGPCWRHITLREQRQTEAARHQGRTRARKGAQR